LAVVIVGGSLLVAIPSAQAALTGFSVTPGQYSNPSLPRHPYVYVPNEILSFTFTGDTSGELFDALIMVRSTGSILQPYNDIAMPASLSVTLTYTIPNSLPDGDDYRVEVGDATYVDTNRGSVRFRFQNFAVQTYTLTVEVDRPAYLGGDDVIVTWSANNLKDGSLAPPGYGQLWVYDQRGPAFPLMTPTVHTYSAASGSFTFSLPDLADPDWDGMVETWFNDSSSNPVRYQRAFTWFDIDSLGVIVDVSPNQYPPGGIVTAYVWTLVSFDQANPQPWEPQEPNIGVDISVWEVPTTGTPIERTQYGATGLVTDAHGRLTYVFKLDASIPDGTDFEVRANASHSNGIWRWEARDSFTVSVAAGLTMVLQFNQDEYQAGDAATVEAIVAGAGTATLTYIFQVRDTTSATCAAGFPDGLLLATDTRQTNTYTYTIPSNFEGQVCFRVTADDGAGNRVTSAREFTVVFGWLLVNSDRREYDAGQTVTITWELKSELLTGPTYFYEVRDDDGNLVTSGTTGTTGTRFEFLVPDPASPSYTFTVTATKDGRTVRGSVSVTEITGFFLTATFDRSSYAPGDTMKIHYRIVVRGGDALPSTFYLTYGLLSGSFGGAFRTTSTGAAQGDLSYVVPKGIDEGDELFQITESNTGTMSIEVVTIRGTSPLWFVTVGDIPVIVWILLVWLILMTLMLWRRGALVGARAPRPEQVPPPPLKQEPVPTSATSPMMVTCRNCGSPIEITTSKRPIEVMCPKCGGTEVVA
jgi:hypothetical protein